MIANKDVNPGQLQAEAVALNGLHASEQHSITGFGANPTMDLYCDSPTMDLSTSEALSKATLCGEAQQALAVHVPAAEPESVTVLTGAVQTALAAHSADIPAPLVSALQALLAALNG